MSTGGKIFLVIIIIAAILGAAYYFLIYKPKQDALGNLGGAEGGTGTAGTGAGTGGTVTSNTPSLSDDELNPANAGKLIYTKVDNAWIIKGGAGSGKDGDTGHEIVPTKGTFIGIITPTDYSWYVRKGASDWGKAPHDNIHIGNGKRAYVNQVWTKEEMILAGRG